jgi:hypothetical protein
MANTKDKAKESKIETIYFKLNTNEAALWGSRDRTIVLSFPQAALQGMGVLYGKVTSDDSLNVQDVLMAFQTRRLIKITKKEYDSNKSETKKAKMVRLNAKVERDGIMKRKIESVLRLEGKHNDVDSEDTIVEYVRSQSDPDVLTLMAEMETEGHARPRVLREIDAALKQASGNGISEALEANKTTYEFTNDQIRVEADIRLGGTHQVVQEEKSQSTPETTK